jgi:hypothetical protein
MMRSHGFDMKRRTDSPSTIVDIRSTAWTQVVATRETICPDCYKGLHSDTEDDDCIKALRVSEQGSVSVPTRRRPQHIRSQKCLFMLSALHSLKVLPVFALCARARSLGVVHMISATNRTRRKVGQLRTMAALTKIAAVMRCLRPRCLSDVRRGQ